MKKLCKSKWSCIFFLSHLQGSFLLGSDVLLLCVVPELLQTRSGQRDATGGEGKREKEISYNVNLQLEPLQGFHCENSC